MTRTDTEHTVTVAPSDNIYTVLAAVATVAVLIGLVVLLIRANTLGVELLKF